MRVVFSTQHHATAATRSAARFVAGQRRRGQRRNAVVVRADSSSSSTPLTSSSSSTTTTTSTTPSPAPSGSFAVSVAPVGVVEADAEAVSSALDGSRRGDDDDEGASSINSSRGASNASTTSTSTTSSAFASSSSSSSSSSSTFDEDEFDNWLLTEAGLNDWVGAVGLRPDDIALDGLVSQMAQRYDPEALAAGVVASAPTRGSGAAMAARAAQVAATLGRVAAGVGADAVSGSLEANAPLRARALRDALASLGPAFVKVGQTLSARPDLLPKPYLDALAELQDSLDPFPTPLALAMIEEELFNDSKAAANASPSPSTSATDPSSRQNPNPSAPSPAPPSIRSVFSSISAEPVAVKVQRPGIAATLAVDMVLLRKLARAVDARAPAILERVAGSKAAAMLAGAVTAQPLAPLVDEFASKVFAELDFVREARNSEKFLELYGDIPGVRVPRVHWDLTRRRVLTTGWVEGGVKLTAPRSELEAAGVDVKKAVNAAVSCTLRQVFGEGFVHGDAHPGNLLATKDALYWIDFGIVCEVPVKARSLLIGHVAHLVGRRYDLMTKDYVALEFLDASVDSSPIEPALRDFFDDVLSAPVSELNMRAIVDGLGAVLFQFPFNINANPFYVTMLRSLASLEGIALSVDPDFQLLGACWPYVAGRLLLAGEGSAAGGGAKAAAEEGEEEEEEERVLREALLSLVLVDDDGSNRRSSSLLPSSPSNSSRRNGSGSGRYTPARINWERLDSLLDAGAQIPGGLPAASLAKLAAWALSGGGGGNGGSSSGGGGDRRLRDAAAAEAARLLDAAVAARVREVILSSSSSSSSSSSTSSSLATGGGGGGFLLSALSPLSSSSPLSALAAAANSRAAADPRALADRLAPVLPGDAEAAERARRLLRLAAPHLPARLASLVGVGVGVEGEGEGAEEETEASKSPPPAQVGVQEALDAARDAAALASDALATSAGREAAAALARELAARFAARSLKALLGPPPSSSSSSSSRNSGSFGSGTSGKRRVSAFTRDTRSGSGSAAEEQDDEGGL